MSAIKDETERSTARLSDRDVAIVRDLLRAVSGIEVRQGQEGLIASRLGGRLAARGLTLREYLDRLGRSGDLEELGRMVDALTTGHSAFFRHGEHFRLVLEHLRDRPRAAGPWRVWSAGCSSGEEPFSLAMAIADARREAGSPSEGEILATDISSSALERARGGCYLAAALAGIDEQRRRRHFERPSFAAGDLLCVRAEIRRRVTFEKRNLVGAWPEEARFAAIFCRNVMIYFDPASRRRLVSRLVERLEPGGLLCLSPVECAGVEDPLLQVLAPAVFRKGSRG